MPTTTPRGPFRIDSLATFGPGATATDVARLWVPCRHPERPLDEFAAVTHVVNGAPCKACAIARGATALSVSEES